MSLLKEEYNESLKMAIDLHHFKQAVVGNDVVSVERYLDEGIDIEHRFIGLQTALHLAIGNGASEVSWLLIQKGADVNVVDNEQETPLLMASKKSGMTVTLSMLIDSDADIDARNKDGSTALMLASLLGNFKAAKLLVKAGANLHVFNQKGRSPLSCALMGLDVIRREFGEDKLTLVKYIAERIDDIDYLNPAGDTVLMMAIKEDETDAVQFLLSKGANPHMTDKEGLDAMGIAYEHGTVLMYDFLSVALENQSLTDKICEIGDEVAGMAF